MLTAQLIKQKAKEFENIRTNGKICITLRENDELISVRKTKGNDMILLGSSSGRMVKFNESEIRVMGRTASGVRGINLDDNVCIGAEIATDDDKILIVTEKGYGKVLPEAIRLYEKCFRPEKGGGRRFKDSSEIFRPLAGRKGGSGGTPADGRQDILPSSEP